jgi:hypothetical protein
MRSANPQPQRATASEADDEPASAPLSPACAELDDAQRQRLLAIARGSIAHGLEQGVALPVTLADEPQVLCEPRASFVTLNLDGQLRGCIGHLEAIGPLATDVSENAFAAAFQDPRFPPVGEAELARVRIAISVLTTPAPVPFGTEAELLSAIEPGIDGLILSEGHRRGTFLPSVWEQLPRRDDFLRHLKQKAGLPGDYWSDRIQVSRYRTESFGE